MHNRRSGLSTLCVHAGTYVDAPTGGVNSPIFTSTAYAYPNPANENVYPRYFNVPNQRVVAAKMAALEKGEAALVFGSGMAAISTLLFAHLKPGDHAVCALRGSYRLPGDSRFWTESRLMPRPRRPESPLRR